MNYATIKPFDVANGPGVRVSLFVSGCTHRCKGCGTSFEQIPDDWSCPLCGVSKEEFEPVEE